MRTLYSLLFGMVILVPGAQAQPLPAGKPAGVKEAVVGTTGKVVLVAAGMIVVLGAIGVVMGGGDSSSGT